jgi:spore germination protein KA
VNALLDGRIVIAMENSQSVMICPYSFLEMFNSPEDFYNRWSTATLLRVLRFAGFFITIMLTPTYISALSYHPGILPFELLIMIQESRSKVPFPPMIEVLFIELVIEIYENESDYSWNFFYYCTLWMYTTNESTFFGKIGDD